jgi:hypothetical protein
MTLVVLGVDALDPELVDSDYHPDLALSAHKSINTVISKGGAPSTHELWPTIITGLPPSKHGLTLADDGVAWGNPVLNAGSKLADYLIPEVVQTKIGAWLLTHTTADAFQTPATYYDEQNITTLFDGKESVAIGIPNYVVNPDSEDREQVLRRNTGELFIRDPDATGGHSSSNPYEFYERCLEMSMVRIARVRRRVRSRQNELIFGYTSGLDLIGHVSYDLPELQQKAYKELNDFVSELRDDLDGEDELVLVSDHGLQDGVHTDEAMIAATDPTVVSAVESVLDIRGALEELLKENDHTFTRSSKQQKNLESERVREQLEQLGYV